MGDGDKLSLDQVVDAGGVVTIGVWLCDGVHHVQERFVGKGKGNPRAGWVAEDRRCECLAEAGGVHLVSVGATLKIPAEGGAWLVLGLLFAQFCPALDYRGKGLEVGLYG